MGLSWSVGCPAPLQRLSVTRGSGQEMGIPVTMTCKMLSLAESKLLFHLQEHTGHPKVAQDSCLGFHNIDSTGDLQLTSKLPLMSLEVTGCSSRSP